MWLKILRCCGGRCSRNRQTPAHCKEYQAISQKDKGIATKEKKMHLCSATRELNLGGRYQLRSTARGQVHHPPDGFTCKVLLQQCGQQQIIKARLMNNPASNYNPNVCDLWGFTKTVQESAIKWAQPIAPKTQKPIWTEEGLSSINPCFKSKVFQGILGSFQEENKPSLADTRSCEIILWIYSLFFQRLKSLFIQPVTTQERFHPKGLYR